MVGKRVSKRGKVNLTEITRLKNPDEMGDFCYLSAENYATRYSVTVPEKACPNPKNMSIFIYI